MAFSVLSFFLLSQFFSLKLPLGHSSDATHNPLDELTGAIFVCVILSLKLTGKEMVLQECWRTLFLARDLSKQLSLKSYWRNAACQMSVPSILDFLDCVPFYYWHPMKHGGPDAVLCVFLLMQLYFWSELDPTLPVHCEVNINFKTLLLRYFWHSFMVFWQNTVSSLTRHGQLQVGDLFYISYWLLVFLL